MTDKLLLDGTRVSDAVYRVMVDGSNANVYQDGTLVYNVGGGVPAGAIGTAPFTFLNTVSNSFDFRLTLNDDGTYNLSSGDSAGSSQLTASGNWNTSAPLAGLGGNWVAKAQFINSGSNSSVVATANTTGFYFSLSGSPFFGATGGGSITVAGIGAQLIIDFSQDGGSTIDTTWTLSFGEATG